MYVCVSFSLLCILALIMLNQKFLAFSYSPVFSGLVTVDPRSDWVNLKTGKNVNNEYYVPDITSVDYSSDGRNLSATFWLFRLFSDPAQIKPEFKEVDYGMLIDSDFNSNTGFGGIDYKIEINWNKQTEKWTQTIEKWSNFGKTRQVENKPIGPNIFQKGGSYVLLSINLDRIQNPEKYKVIFYTDSRKENGEVIIDYTRWIAIPPLVLVSQIYPTTIDLVQGERKTVQVTLNSTEGYQPIVSLSANTGDKEVIPSIDLQNITVPSYGVITIPLTVYASKDAKVGPTTLFVFVNSSFPPEELLKIKGEKNEQRVSPFNVISRASALVLTDRSPDLVEQVGSVWSKIGDFTNFIYGIIVGISPFIYTRIKKTVSKSE